MLEMSHMLHVLDASYRTFRVHSNMALKDFKGPHVLTSPMYDSIRIHSEAARPAHRHTMKTESPTLLMNNLEDSRRFFKLEQCIATPAVRFKVLGQVSFHDL